MHLVSDTIDGPIPVFLTKNNHAIDLEEKPLNPRSHYAVTGLYMYDKDVVDVAKTIKPSARGELEITDVNKFFLKQNTLRVELFDRGTAWLDTGTHDSLLEASQFVQTLEKRQGMKISCIEEIAFRMGYINKNQLRSLGEKMGNNQYSQYLLKIADHNIKSKKISENL